MTPLAVLLLHLGQATLVLLLGLGQLLAGLGQHLFSLLAALLAQLSALAFRFLADALAVDQLLPLLAGLIEDFLGLLAGLIDEVLPLGHQLFGLGQLRWQCFTHRIHQLDRILFIHQATAAEGHAGAVQHDLLQLIELVEHGSELRLSHHGGSRG